MSAKSTILTHAKCNGWSVRAASTDTTLTLEYGNERVSVVFTHAGSVHKASAYARGGGQDIDREFIGPDHSGKLDTVLVWLQNARHKVGNYAPVAGAAERFVEWFDMNAAERFVEWFNTTGREVIDLPLDLECNDSAERYSVECWVDATPDSETTMDDYHAVVELVSSGIVEIGDDGRAYYRGNPVRNVTGEIVQAAHDAVDAQPDKAHMFTVHWSMEIYADDALQAAIIARDIQRDPNSVASEFTVTDDDGSVSIDLDRD